MILSIKILIGFKDIKTYLDKLEGLSIHPITDPLIWVDTNKYRKNVIPLCFLFLSSNKIEGYFFGLIEKTTITFRIGYLKVLRMTASKKGCGQRVQTPRSEA